MDTFIVRIYRRGKDGLAGTVEVVDGGEKRSFIDVEELLGILQLDLKGDLKKNSSSDKA